jgi:hypothetical protein
MILSQDFRNAIAATLENPPPDIALSLSYHDLPISLAKITRDLHRLHAMIDRRIIGRDYVAAPASKRSKYWAVIELLTTSPHVHCGWYFPSCDLHRASPMHAMESLLMNGAWKKFARNGSWNMQPFQPNWSGYATKVLETMDHVILSDNIDLSQNDTV